MKRSLFVRTMEAANDIVQRVANGQAELDPLTVEWAQQILRNNAVRLRASPTTERLLQRWDDDLLAGYTFPQLHEWLGIERSKATTWGLILKLVKEKQLFSLIERGHSLYFATRMARDRAQPEFEAAKERRLNERIERDKARQRAYLKQRSKEPNMTKAKPSTATREQRILNEDKATPFNRQRRPKPSVTASNVVPIQCPSSHDTRYTPVLPPEGGEFTQAWRQLRGQA